MKIEELQKELLRCEGQLKDCMINEDGRYKEEHIKEKISAIKSIMEQWPPRMQTCWETRARNAFNKAVDASMLLMQLFPKKKKYTMDEVFPERKELLSFVDEFCKDFTRLKKQQIMKSKKPIREFYLRVDDEGIRVNEPQTWVTATGGDSYSISFETKMSKKELEKVKKAAKKQQKEFDKIYDREWTTGIEMNVGDKFTMNNQVYEVIEEEIPITNKTMETKTKKHEVEIPKGMKVKRELWPTTNSDQVTIEFEPIKKERPKTWEEFANSKNWTETGHMHVSGPYAEAHNSLFKLILLRDVYNEGLEALGNPVSIYRKEKGDKVIMGDCVRGALVLHHDVALEFYTNFRDNLLEQAKPLL